MKVLPLNAGAVAALAAGLVTLGGTSAFASETAEGAPAIRTGNDCRSWIEATTEGRAEHRVAAVCTSLDPDTRARGVADFTAQEDVHTGWITETGRTYYSPWRAYIWKPPTHRMEYQRR